MSVAPGPPRVLTTQAQMTETFAKMANVGHAHFGDDKMQDDLGKSLSNFELGFDQHTNENTTPWVAVDCSFPQRGSSAWLRGGTSSRKKMNRARRASAAKKSVETSNSFDLLAEDGEDKAEDKENTITDDLSSLLEPTWIEEASDAISLCSFAKSEEFYAELSEDEEPFVGWTELQMKRRWCGCGTRCRLHHEPKEGRYVHEPTNCTVFDISHVYSDFVQDGEEQSPKVGLRDEEHLNPERTLARENGLEEEGRRFRRKRRIRRSIAKQQQRRRAKVESNTTG